MCIDNVVLLRCVVGELMQYCGVYCVGGELVLRHVAVNYCITEVCS